MGIFDRIQSEIEAREKQEGITPADLLDLSDQLRRLMNRITRDRQMDVEAAAELLGESSANTVKMLNALVDKGYLERVQRDLRASEKRYRVLFDSGVDLVLVCEVVGEQVPGKIIEANQVACQRLGHTREELLELTPMEILASESRRDFPALIQTCLSGGPAFFEVAAVAKGGTEIPAEVGAHLFEFDERSVLLLLLRDVTSRKRAEEALRASERRFQDVARTTGDSDLHGFVLGMIHPRRSDGKLFAADAEGASADGESGHEEDGVDRGYALVDPAVHLVRQFVEGRLAG